MSDLFRAVWSSSIDEAFSPEKKYLGSILLMFVAVASSISIVSAQTLQWPVSPDNRGNLGQDYAQFNHIKNFRLHTGLDISGIESVTQVVAAASGIVKRMDVVPSSPDYPHDNHCMGNVVIIDHSFGANPAGPFTLYAHLYSITVADGSSVSQGDQIGTVGTTGFNKDSRDICRGSGCGAALTF